MFERFTDRARRVIVLAQDEARALNHHYIGTEHILLGLLSEGEGVAAQALTSLGVDRDEARTHVEGIIGKGEKPPTGHIPFTPRAKKAIELSLREALTLGHNYIGTEHILLGLIREGEGVGANTMVNLGADLNTTRAEVIKLLNGYQKASDPAPSQELAATLKVAYRSLQSRTDGMERLVVDTWPYDEYEMEQLKDRVVVFERAGTKIVVKTYNAKLVESTELVYKV